MPLPSPVTTDQEYLAAILSELRGLRSELAQASRVPAEVLHYEPAPVPDAVIAQIADKINKAMGARAQTFELREPAPAPDAKSNGRRKR